MKHLVYKFISRRRKAKSEKFGAYAYTLFFLAAMAFTCCTDKDIEGGESDKISLLTQIQTFSHEGGSQALKLESGASWVISVDENAKSWCSLSPTSGSRHDHDVALVVQPNTSTEERNTRITFSNTLTYPPHSINALVTQKHPDALTITSNKITIPSDGGKAEVETRSNLTAECTIDATNQSWIHASTTRAMSRQVFSFTIDENSRPEPREGYIIVHAGQLTERVTIYQEGKVPHLMLSNHHITALSCDNVVKVEMNSNINYYYDLPQVDWLYEPETRAISTYTHHIGVRENPDYKPRQIDIVFHASLTDETDTLHLTQMGRNALVAAYPEYWFDDCDHNFGLMLNTDARLEYKINCEWIKIKKVPTVTKFDETYSIYDYVFTIENNISDTPRTGSITFNTKGGTSQTVLIHQGRCNSQMRMVVSHNALNMLTPTLHGTHISGTIDWGDGQTESYQQSEKHEYKDDSPRRVTLDSKGARDVTLHSLVGVSDVTFQVNQEIESEGTESFEQDVKEWEE